MVSIYVRLILTDPDYTIDMVPILWREKVRAELEKYKEESDN